MSVLGNNGIYEYSIGATLAYDDIVEELYLINPDYDYIYTYNIPTKSWTKRGETYDKTFNVGEDSYGFNNTNKMLVRFFEEYGSGVLPVLLETKPISLGTPDYKKIKRIAIRGSFEPESGKLHNQASYDKFLGAYLWVSKDGVNYHMIEPKQVQKKCNDIIFKRFPVTVKYFVVVFCGHMTNDSYITHIDVDYDKVYEEKIR